MLLANVILGLVALSTLCLIVFLADSFFGKLDFITHKAVVGDVITIIKQKGLEGGNFYDLGSSRGALAVRVARKLPRLKVNGIDDNWSRVLFARVRALLIQNIRFNREDVFTADVSVANIVYIYLPQDLMEGLRAKLQKELKPGSWIISYKVSFANWQAAETLGQLFIYQMT